MYHPNARLLAGLLPVMAIIVLACGSGSDNDDAQRLASTQTPRLAAPLQAAPPVPSAAPVAVATVEVEPLSDEDRNYLDKVIVTFGLTLTGTNSIKFQRILQEDWPFRSQQISALLEAGVGERFLDAQKALESIGPPERFVEDHASYVAHIDELVRLDTEAAKAVENGNLAEFSLINGEIEQTRALFWSNISRQFCFALSLTGVIDRATCKGAEGSGVVR